MAVDAALVGTVAGGIGTVAGFLLKHYTNGKHVKEDSGNAAAAEFRGEMRAVMKTLADTQAKAVDLMGDVHKEIAHTNEVLELIEVRGRGTEAAIRKILGGA